MIRIWSNNVRSFFSTRTHGNFDLHQFPGITKCIINKPKVLNSLNTDMVLTLQKEVPTFNNTKAVWFEGAGGKAFCAGGDIKALFTSQSKVEDRLQFFREQFTVDYMIANLKSQQIAVWDGIVMGGGFGITSMAPFKIATENSLYAMPEAKLGFFTDVCACYTLSRMRNNIGFYLGLTGARLKGQDLYVAGLANYYIPKKHLETIFEELKSTLPNSNNPKKTVTDILNKYHQSSGRTTIPHQKQIKQLFGLKDFREIYKEAHHRNDQFSIGVAKALDEQCPPAVGVIHHLISTAGNLSYKECIQRDFKLAQHYAVDPNFAEGVRSVLIEKGSKPFWSHKSILEVTDEDVRHYFTFPKTFQSLNI